MIGINLIPVQQRQARRNHSHLVRWAVAIGLVAVVGAIPITVGLAKATRVARLKLESRTDQAKLVEQRRELSALTMTLPIVVRSPVGVNPPEASPHLGELGSTHSEGLAPKPAKPPE